MLETTAHQVVAAGTVVSLKLEGQGVGGYVWTVPELPPGMELAGEAYQEVVDHGVGGGAVFHVQLRAAKPGRYVLRCERKRPWGGEPAERRTVTIDVE